MLLLIFNNTAYGQDTNRNLRAVDKMLERYKDIGEHKAAVVHAVCICLLANHLYRLQSVFYYKRCNNDF